MGRAVLILPLLPLLAAAQETSLSPVAVFLGFEDPPPAASLKQMKRQATDSLRPMGYVPEWRLLQDSRGNEAFERLAVVRFRGRCRASGDEVEGFGDRHVRLASSAVSGGKVLPFAEVDCGRLSRFLSMDMRRLDSHQQESGFGQALGRVVAHELYHILMNTLDHRHRGIGKGICTAGDLLAARDRKLFDAVETSPRRRAAVFSVNALRETR